MTPPMDDGGVCDMDIDDDGACVHVDDIDTKSVKILSLKASYFFLPKKSSERPLGQDAYFISCSKQTIGDGVGGITSTDSGVYPRELMIQAHRFVKTRPAKSVDPMEALQAAYVNSNSNGGASTACIITLNRNSLHAANLGDSGFMVVRGDKIVYRSPAQQHDFNCPFKLGGSGRTTPCHADKVVVDVEAGDVVVAATDGLFDNLFDAEIEAVVKIAMWKVESPTEVAARLGEAVKWKYDSMKRCVTPENC